jgi:hypothetical protein
MNSLKGLGVCAVLAGIIFALTQVKNTSLLILGISVTIVTMSLFTWAAAVKRRRMDRQVAAGGAAAATSPAMTVLKVALPVVVLAAGATALYPVVRPTHAKSTADAHTATSQGSPAPSASASASAAPVSIVRTGPSGVMFDDFHYSGPNDPNLAAHGWQARTNEGGPGIQDTWSPDGVSFPSDSTAKGGQALQLHIGTDGTSKGTKQTEFESTSPDFFTGTFAARIHFSDKPASGRDGDHVVQSFYTISPADSSTKYSELDNEYMPNGGWGSVGPELDTTSWYSAKPADRVTHALKQQHLDGWHTVVITATSEKTTYSVDGKVLFTSSGKYVPREHMGVHFSAWFIDLTNAATGNATWDMKVNWFYYKAGQTLSLSEVQKAVNGYYAGGTHYVNGLSPQ